MFFLLLTALIISLQSEAFNVDDKFPIRFSPLPAGSYFGYTVAFLNNPHGKWVIVGAPRANSTYGGRGNINEPGEIFRCKLDIPSSQTCLTLHFGNASSSNQRLKEDNGWLGVSLDISDDDTQLVACGHLLKNRPSYIPKGNCYLANLNDINRTETRQTVKEFNNQEIKGISAQFVKKTTALIVAIRFEIYQRSDVVYIENNSASKHLRDSTSSSNSYYGYALASGNFFSREKSQIVVGAPNDNYIGKVHIQDVDMRSVVFLSGQQIGEHFGASLCAIDLNKDGWDDLIVGAPLHSEDIDEGKVYVFINSKNNQMNLQREIKGSAVSARFGSSIAAIGDLDLDGFQDIAIGAPYENDGKGAVYIYHGGSTGIKPKCQQKIMAKGSTRGFGISIAGGMDADGNKYPDIAIGAFGSGEVFIHRTSPTLKVQTTMTTDKDIIDVDEVGCKNKRPGCFPLKICFNTSLPTEITRTLAVDTLMLGENSRVIILVPETSGKKTITSIIQIPGGRNFCDTIELLVTEKPKDYFTPIKMELSFQMNEKSTSTFCSKCPVMDPSTITKIEKEVRFKTKCKGSCIADLKVKAWIPGFKRTFLIIGSTNRISLKVNVSNAGDPAYITSLTVNVPQWMTFDTIPTNCYKKLPLYCDVANMLDRKMSSILEFTLNIEDIPIVKDGNFTINCTTDSQSEENNGKDNMVVVNVPIKSVSEVFLIGSTNEEQIIYDRTKVKIEEGSTVSFSHVFEVGNAGPTALKTPLKFELRLPEFIGDSNEPIMQISVNTKSPVICDPRIIHSDPQETTTRDNVVRTSTTSHMNRRDIKNGPEVIKETQSVETAPANVAILNCSTARCEPALCTIGPLLKDESIKLHFTIVASLFPLAKVMSGKDAVVIVTEARVYLDERKEKFQFKKVMTEIKPGGVPPSEMVATWIIVASVAGGLLVLILLILLLWKMGFFKRPKKEEMKRLTTNIQFMIEPEDLNTKN